MVPVGPHHCVGYNVGPCLASPSLICHGGLYSLPAFELSVFRQHFDGVRLAAAISGQDRSDRFPVEAHQCTAGKISCSIRCLYKLTLARSNWPCGPRFRCGTGVLTRGMVQCGPAPFWAIGPGPKAVARHSRSLFHLTFSVHSDMMPTLFASVVCLLVGDIANSSFQPTK